MARFKLTDVLRRTKQVQSKADIEKFYEVSDPWEYERNADDAFRKQLILSIADLYSPYQRALDIGCGEGFITVDLPAKEIEGVELSKNASKRVPEPVKVVEEPDGGYDLVLATGVLYEQYNYEYITELIKKHATNIVITCSIKDWERNNLSTTKQIGRLEFPYREYQQILRVYEW